MKNHLKIITLITTVYLLHSCSYFSKDKEEKEKEYELKRIQKSEIDANKEYQYLNQSIAYETNIPKDTVAIVLREYYKNYDEFAFNSSTNKLEEFDNKAELDEDYKPLLVIVSISKLDFINSIVKKQLVTEKSAYSIFNKIDYFFNNKRIYDKLEDIQSEIDDLKPTD